MDGSSPATESTNQVAWKPLTAKQRRVLGTLMEKSKTTPDAYPMSFQGLMTGCNQKSNRAPISMYTTEQVEAIVDELRELGAVTIVQGSGRVTKVRHYAYQWLGISKTEGAIMTELLLRGEQTFGELRTRASRMEPIASLDELKQLVDELKRRDLVVELSPAGRGQMLSHNLYPEWELEQLKKQVAVLAPSQENQGDDTNSSRPAISNQFEERIANLESQLAAVQSTVEALNERLIQMAEAIGLEKA